MEQFVFSMYACVTGIFDGGKLSAKLSIQGYVILQTKSVSGPQRMTTATATLPIIACIHCHTDKFWKVLSNW